MYLIINSVDPVGMWTGSYNRAIRAYFLAIAALPGTGLVRMFASL
jgi:hypothetical protein